MALEIFYKTRVVYSGCRTDIDLQSYCKNTRRLIVAVVFPFIADGMDEDKLLTTERIGWHIFRKLYEKLREVYEKSSETYEKMRESASSEQICWGGGFRMGKEMH